MARNLSQPGQSSEQFHKKMHNVPPSLFENQVYSNTKWYSNSNHNFNEHLSCSHPWVGDIRLASWNAHGLFINDKIRRQGKLKFVIKSLFKEADLVCIQEAHLASRSFALARKLAGKHGFVFFGVPGNQAVGGVTCFCRSSFSRTSLPVCGVA